MGRKKGKLSKGQPAGSRSASGRKRDRAPLRVAPADGVMRRHELYRVAANDDVEDNAKNLFYNDTCDAIGRAYCAGLLGSGDEARALLVAGRRIAWRYWKVYVLAGPSQGKDSLAPFFPIDAMYSEPKSPEDEKREEVDFADRLRKVDRLGLHIRRAFNQLVLNQHIDAGPDWLERIVWAHRHHKTPTERDSNMLRLAKEGLEAVA